MNDRIKKYLDAKHKHLELGMRFARSMVDSNRDIGLSIQHDFSAVGMLRTFEQLTTEDQNWLVNMDGDRSEVLEKDRDFWISAYGNIRGSLTSLLHDLGIINRHHARRMGMDEDRADTILVRDAIEVMRDAGKKLAEENKQLREKLEMAEAEAARLKVMAVEAKKELSAVSDPYSTEHSCFIHGIVMDAYKKLDGVSIEEQEDNEEEEAAGS